MQHRVFWHGADLGAPLGGVAWSVMCARAQIIFKPTGREGADQLPPGLAAARLRPRGTDFERPLQLRLLSVSKKAHEREIERGLLNHLRDLLLELRRGFSFVGSQVPLEVGGETFHLDLLFYHLRLHCYFVIEILCWVAGYVVLHSLTSLLVRSDAFWRNDNRSFACPASLSERSIVPTVRHRFTFPTSRLYEFSVALSTGGGTPGCCPLGPCLATSLRSSGRASRPSHR
jgi:hypothetical protein